MNSYPALQFSMFRILFGLYLSIFFFAVLPHGETLFSSNGMLPDVKHNLTYGYFPNLLVIADSPAVIYCWILSLAVLALFFSLGVFRRAAAVLLWYGLTCLVNRNEMFWSPAMPFLGWLLLASALVPSGEPYCLIAPKRSASDWQMPKELFWGASLIMALSYSVSGLFKLLSPSWVEGTAITQALDWMWSRDWFYVDFFLALPDIFRRCIAWFALFLELLYAPMCISRFGRKICWFAMVGMHINLLLLLDLVDLTIGVLFMHFFVFDCSWFGENQQET